MPSPIAGLLWLLAAETAEIYLGQLLLETATHYRCRRDQQKLDAWLCGQTFKSPPAVRTGS